MRRRGSFFALLFLIVNGISLGISGQSTTTIVHSYEPAEGYLFQAYAIGTTTWNEDETSQIFVNITMNNVPSSLSKIDIQLVGFTQMGDVSGQEVAINTVVDTPSFSLSETNRTLLINQTLNPPDEVDRFFLNISILLRTTGTVDQVEVSTYSFRFPDTGTILVSRDRLGQLVQLYGFPPNSFFVAWFPYYFGFLFLMSFPAIIVASDKLLSWLREERKKTVTDEEEEN
ncbi:MAG: hypothetical protein IH840_01675 [Candidatus Heimdallarchaeota archaeon]|nr:hypothetical protein [Candidatus Heimdallarchaeota archaeon]